jgi:hypothetical protein
MSNIQYKIMPAPFCNLEQRARVKSLMWDLGWKANTLFATEQDALIHSHHLGEDEAWVTIVPVIREPLVIR